MKEKDVEVCDHCGASVYPEHLESGKAAAVEGRLMCPHCLADYKKSHHAGEQRYVGQTTMRAPGEGEEMEAISVIEDAPESSQPQEIRPVGGETVLGQAAQWDESAYRRPLNPISAGATRCRVFHTRLNDGAIDFMSRLINEWVDGHDDIIVKFATSTIGTFEGKKSEPALIVTVFY